MSVLSTHLHNQEWMLFIEPWNPTGLQTQHSELSWAFRVSLILEPLNPVKIFKPNYTIMPQMVVSIGSVLYFRNFPG